MTTEKSRDIDKMTFEQALSELEETVSLLERGEAGLDQAMSVYSRGKLLQQHCMDKLTKAKLQVEKINVDGNDNINLVPFNPD